MSENESCCTCQAILDEHEMFIVAVDVKRKNGETIPAELEVCPECANDLECVVLLDDNDTYGDTDIKIRDALNPERAMNYVSSGKATP